MRVCVSCVEGGVCVCVLPRGWYVRVRFLCGGWGVRVCPAERVACARVCVSWVEGGVCICVLPRGWHVHVCGFSYVEGGMCICVLPRGGMCACAVYVCFLCLETL